jgi:predicted ArsR family transcriptional regulator
MKRGDLTADEAAALLGRSVLSIRPRFAELHRMGALFHSGKRRKNASGMTATVWTISKQAQLF